MDKKILLHIPHSSTKIPLLEGFVVDAAALEHELLKLTDWYTDDLFFSAEDEMIVADFSRIFCDVERFVDDSREIMAQFGMGVLYEKTDDANALRIVTPELREKILQSYYWKHHRRLGNAVNHQLRLYGQALILDCHSYPAVPLVRDLDKTAGRPDFNIGTDQFHTSEKIIARSVSFFEKSGYSLGIDWPYKGSIVPLAHFRKNKNVQTIMLEVNRKLYLKEPTNEKSAGYSEIKALIGDYIRTLRDAL